MNETLIKYALSVPEGTKFDFQNIDVKLYLALKALIVLAEEEAQSLVYLGREDDATQEAANNAEHLVEQAVLALAEFELAAGPLPDWASDWNWNSALVVGAQLMTKDGRRMGNAHIVKSMKVDLASEVTASNPYGEDTYYKCLTDAGSVFTFNSKEIHEAFWIGKFLSTPDRIIQYFDREGHFVKEPK